MATIRIGTSGWSYPHWRERFYPRALPAEEWLSYYAERFATVEVNATFYRLQPPDAVAEWRRASPAGFVFAAKVSRFITHMKKLKDADKTLPPFLETIRPLGPKLGPLLVQLPPRWGCNAARLETFLDALPRRQRAAVELRDESWWNDEIRDLLAARGIAVCLFHLAGVWSPRVETADFVYFRLHGPDGPYSGSYDTATLRRVAGWCRDWRDRGLDVFGYFDNDQNAYAPANALTFMELIDR